MVTRYAVFLQVLLLHLTVPICATRNGAKNIYVELVTFNHEVLGPTFSRCDKMFHCNLVCNIYLENSL